MKTTASFAPDTIMNKAPGYAPVFKKPGFAPIIVVTFFAAIAGCATNNDVENIQAQINGLHAQTDVLNTDIGNASVAVSHAKMQADNAEAAAVRAENETRMVNEKLDRMLSQQ
jgi:outer membrane murein-binding lipoprotein Lpp